MTTFVRSYMESGRFFRKNVYKVELTDTTATLTPQFGNFRDAFSLTLADYEKFLDNTDLIPVQPIRNIVTDEVFFIHDTLGASMMVNWTNGALSGIMSSNTLGYYKPVEL